MKHWADGGETKLANLVLLRHHHGAIHEAGWSIETGGDGDFAFVNPQGRVLPTVPSPPRLGDHPLATLVADHRRLGLRISSRTIIPDWQGQRLDASIALDNLIHLRRRRTHERALQSGGTGGAGSTSTGSAESSDGPPRGSTTTS